jgi:hypothetical protein
MIEVKKLTINEQEDLGFAIQEDINNGTVWASKITSPQLRRSNCYLIKDLAYWDAYALFDPVTKRCLALYSQVLSLTEATKIIKNHLTQSTK